MENSTENKESYLNLKPEQFDSWLGELELKFNNLEQSNIKNTVKTNSESIDTYENFTESDSERDSELNSSNVFIKNSDNHSSNHSSNPFSNQFSNSFSNQFSNNYSLYSGKSEVEIITDSDIKSTSSSKSLFRFGKTMKRPNRISEENISQQNLENTKIKKDETKKNVSELSYNKIIHNNISIEKEEIMTLTQLNNIIPSLNSKNNIENINNIENTSNTIEKKRIRLGNQALYQYINNRNK